MRIKCSRKLKLYNDSSNLIRQALIRSGRKSGFLQVRLSLVTFVKFVDSVSGHSTQIHLLTQLSSSKTIDSTQLNWNH